MSAYRKWKLHTRLYLFDKNSNNLNKLTSKLKEKKKNNNILRKLHINKALLFYWIARARLH